MAPKFAPKVWKRPYTSIYNDNYRYGSSLYSDAIVDIERKYNEAMATTRLARDRPDLGLSSFADSQLTGASVAARDRTVAATENLSSERSRAISLGRTNSYLEESERKLAHSPSFDTYSAVKALDRINSDIEESRLKRSTSVRRRRPESVVITPTTAYESALLNRGGNSHADNEGPGQSFWMERWYRNSMRSVAHELYPPSLLKTMVMV